jgi:hypothetical protein
MVLVGKKIRNHLVEQRTLTVVVLLPIATVLRRRGTVVVGGACLCSGQVCAPCLGQFSARLSSLPANAAYSWPPGHAMSNVMLGCSQEANAGCCCGGLVVGIRYLGRPFGTSFSACNMWSASQSGFSPGRKCRRRVGCDFQFSCVL